MVAVMTQTVNAAMELACQHDQIDGLATRIATLDPGPGRATCVHELCARFVVHVQAEERYLHPAIRQRLSDGASMAASQERRDRAVARIVERVECGKAAGHDDGFEVLVAHLVAGVRDHIGRQDAILLPALIKACSLEEFSRLGEQLRDGVVVARQAARRAGVRVRERAVQRTRQAQDGDRAPSAAVEGEPRCCGYGALLQRMAWGGPAADAVG
jgi:hypothetical protein